MIVQSSYCGHCGRLLQFGGNPYLTIGEPVAQCGQCGKLSRRKGVNEWDLKTTYEKAATYITNALAVSALSFFCAFMASNLIEKKRGIMLEDSFVWLLVAGFAFWTPIAAWILRRAIASSRRRLASPEYVRILREAGVVR